MNSSRMSSIERVPLGGHAEEGVARRPDDGAADGEQRR
jgi:hypothetical protein